ncbi:MAG: hypothetical protein H7X71_03450 [Chitinophagales bacterium]|nr:hypothetical protein [Chitinophagales bacterium]
MKSASCYFLISCSFILFHIPVKAKFYAADSSRKDSSVFAYADAKFDINDKTSFHKSINGFIINYPETWERDRRTTDNLVLYVRPSDPKFPAQFREMFTILREPVEDTSKTLYEYVMMQNAINETTWKKYNIDYEVLLMSEFSVNGFSAYQVHSSLPKVSQEKLQVIIIKDHYAYRFEYTATNLSYDVFLEDVRKVINSFVFTE